MELRRESYAGAGARTLAQALGTELLARYDGRGGSGGEPQASDFQPPDGASSSGTWTESRSPAAFEKRL